MVKYHRIWFRPNKLILKEEPKLDQPTLEPFVIGYFKENIVDEDLTEQERVNMRNAEGLLYKKVEKLIDEKFLKMNNPAPEAFF